MRSLLALLIASAASSVLACSSSDSGGTAKGMGSDAGAGNGAGGSGGSTSGTGGQSNAGAGGQSNGGTSAGNGGGGNVGGGSVGGSAGSGGGLGGSGGKGGAVAASCQPILNQASLDTGFDSCEDGSKRRRAAILCPTEKTSATSPCMPGFGPPDCTSDAQCTQEPHGYCADAHKLTGYCGCYYGCQKDSDCAAGSLCECGVVVGQCVPAACVTSADCGAGFGCVATRDGTPGPVCTNGYPALSSRYACQTAADECRGDKDCPGGGSNPGACLFDAGHRACGTICLPTP